MEGQTRAEDTATRVFSKSTLNFAIDDGECVFNSLNGLHAVLHDRPSRTVSTAVATACPADGISPPREGTLAASQLVMCSDASANATEISTRRSKRHVPMALGRTPYADAITRINLSCLHPTTMPSIIGHGEMPTTAPVNTDSFAMIPSTLLSILPMYGIKIAFKFFHRCCRLN